MKKHVNAIGSQPNTIAVVEALGLEMSFLEIQENGEKIYRSIVDYPDAKISLRETYKASALLQALESHRAALEKQFGKAFSAGDLEK